MIYCLLTNNVSTIMLYDSMLAIWIWISHVLSGTLADGVYRERVEEMRWHGLQSHVEVTPTFFINGFRYTGANDLDDLLVAIEDAGFRITSSISSF